MLAALEAAVLEATVVAEALPRYDVDDCATARDTTPGLVVDDELTLLWEVLSVTALPV